MNEELTLFDFKSDSIHINIVARFENGNLIIDGYDIGKTVEEAWGDSDYEYILTIHQEEVSLLCEELKINTHDHHLILQEIAKRFQGNTCFSDIEKFLTDKKIKYERFTWT